MNYRIKINHFVFVLQFA